MSALQTTTELLRLLSEPTRVRLLALLHREELTVAELTGVTQLSQSRVSTHLGKLREAGFVRDRRVGSSSYYSLDRGGMPEEAQQLWELMRQTTRDAVLEQDRARADEIVEARKRGVSWADAVAGQMERHYSPGRTWEATARGLLGLCDLGDVLDIASGDGALAELVAPRARSVTCLDSSAKVIAAAKRRLGEQERVRFVEGDMHALPFDDGSFDAVMFMNGLPYAADPATALQEAARVLRSGGVLTGVTLERHQHERVTRAYGHVNTGSTPKGLRRSLERAGLTVERCEITSRESRPPHFRVITFHARRASTRATT
ncbi:MAG TPA: metalloregulator ArsR/SmtB family transcription factor [Polyangiaceae bacterium]|nr:metalloregulator ArsR/SmtB family transcription factor [Polyangiaceae bacterium]